MSYAVSSIYGDNGYDAAIRECEMDGTSCHQFVPGDVMLDTFSLYTTETALGALCKHMHGTFRHLQARLRASIQRLPLWPQAVYLRRNNAVEYLPDYAMMTPIGLHWCVCCCL